jgi:hypothetical protein
MQKAVESRCAEPWDEPTNEARLLYRLLNGIQAMIDMARNICKNITRDSLTLRLDVAASSSGSGGGVENIMSMADPVFVRL